MYLKESSRKIKLFDSLLNSVQQCNLCDKCTHNKVLSYQNGNVDSKVLFIAEAPGRLGADKYCIPLFGDKTGDTFNDLLSNIGWNRDNIFITNALLCNLRDENGNNRTPHGNEIRNCSAYLDMTINLISPDVIVTLGQKALSALGYIHPHKIILKENVAQPILWKNSMTIFPMYHPGPRALIYRSLAKQRGDYIALSSYVHPFSGIKKQKSLTGNSKKTNNDITHLYSCIYSVLQILRYCSYFKLMKLLYFIDLYSIDRYGHSQSNSIFLRRQDGPWCPDVNGIILEGIKAGKILNVKTGKKTILKYNDKNIEIQNPKIDVAIIREVCNRLGNMDDSRIKTIAYLTKPMKYIISQEKKGFDMHNKPIIYKNKTIIDDLSGPV